MEGSSPAVSVKSLEKSTPLSKPPSTVPNVPNEPDSNPDPNLSDYSSLELSNLLDSREVKRKNTRKRHWSRNHKTIPNKKCAMIVAKLIKAAYNLKVTKLKPYEDPIQSRFY